MKSTILRLESRDKIERAIGVLKLDVAIGHDFSSAAEVIAKELKMSSIEHQMFRRVASSMKIEETIVTRLSKGSWT